MVDYLTSRDVENYGTELIDLSQRAALNVVAPHLQNLEQQNFELQRRLAQESRRNMDAAVERAIPQYRELDRDPAWHNWLLGIDALSGQRRQNLLNDAIASGDSSRAIAFFRSFFGSPQQGTGQSTQHTAARRQSSYQSPSGRMYTRADIAQLYQRQRKGEFTEPEWARLEHEIIAASREGRIVGAESLTGGK